MSFDEQTESILSPDEMASGASRGALFSPSRLFLERLLNHLACGRITVTMPGGARFVRRAAAPGPEASLEIVRWRALRRLIWRGDIGFARAFMDGDFTTPDLAALLELAARNADLLNRAISGSPVMRLVNQVQHRRRANTRRGSRRNIMAHYDLGNAFYQRWLDESMTYSSALFTAPGQSLEAAQEAKLDLIVDQLALKGGERVLEIGIGWGALAQRLAERGCHVTGVTLSPSQLRYAQDRLTAAGLAERADLRLQDYREIEGSFDRIVSIEMIEAVGERYWPVYFSTLHDRLKAGGRAVVQAITMADDRFADYASKVDFIQHYIFPGGMLPSPKIMGEASRRAGLVPADTTTFGSSYAETLAHWRHRFLAAWPDIAPLGFDVPFQRLWEFYLSYCEAGFRTGAIDVGAYVLVKPGGR